MEKKKEFLDKHTRVFKKSRAEIMTIKTKTTTVATRAAMLIAICFIMSILLYTRKPNVTSLIVALLLGGFFIWIFSEHILIGKKLIRNSNTISICYFGLHAKVLINIDIANIHTMRYEKQEKSVFLGIREFSKILISTRSSYFRKEIQRKFKKNEKEGLMEFEIKNDMRVSPSEIEAFFHGIEHVL